MSEIKSLPIMIVLLFTIKQYVRERTFQEEYAFKSAVSLTILAYSHQLKDEINKDKMIMDSVTNVYDSPIPKKNHKLANQKFKILLSMFEQS